MQHTLSTLATGQTARVVALRAQNSPRLAELGITPNTLVTKIRAAPMGDPVEILLRGYHLSLRGKDCENIIVDMTPSPQGSEPAHQAPARGGWAAFSSSPCSACAVCVKPLRKTAAPLKLALVGNPNSGKTSLFNALTGAAEYVGNRPGVTVQAKEGKLRTEFACSATVVDLPGVYSLTPYSMEEQITREFLLRERPDAIINIVDATNLVRNLYLTLALLELEIPLVVALNMIDELKRKGQRVDCGALSRRLGAPVLPISAKTGEGLFDMCAAACAAPGSRARPPDALSLYGRGAGDFVNRVSRMISDSADAARFRSVELLVGDSPGLALPEGSLREIKALQREYMQDSPTGDAAIDIAHARYAKIEALTSGIAGSIKPDIITERIDRVLTDRRFAIPVFLCVIMAVFALTFSSLGSMLGEAMANAVDMAAMAVSELLLGMSAPMWLESLVTGGIISGVGGVLTFLPQIILLFTCLSLLEDSGYMARIAFIMDKPMRALGLSGKSFIPLLMGFGCTVPAATGARALNSQRDKRMTIMLLPFMSCSAKLPVYSLMAGAFFPGSELLIIASLYVLSALLGVCSARVYNNLAFAGEEVGLLIELPPYRLPTLRSTWLHVACEIKHFLIKAGTVIFAVSLVLWFFTNFDSGFNMTYSPQSSMLWNIGAWISPIFAPLGFDFPAAAVALVAGLVAKESVVSSLALFYGFAGASFNAARVAMGVDFSPASALAFLVFVLLYTPCAAAMFNMSRELGGRGRGLFVALYQFALAYAVSAVVYALVGLLGM